MYVQGCYEAAKDHLLHTDWHNIHTDFSWFDIVIVVGTTVDVIVVRISIARSLFVSCTLFNRMSESHCPRAMFTGSKMTTVRVTGARPEMASAVARAI